jgi:hypothetical protein
VLTASDLTYLGSFKVPVGEGPSQTLYYSAGYFALRRGRDGSGPLTFLMTGPRQTVSGWDKFPRLREFSYPGEDLTTPPAASVVRDYADIYGSRMVIATPTDGGPITYGLWYDQVANVLWWTYQTAYNLDHNASLGATQFNADGTVTVYGPWRTSAHSGKTGGFIVPIPQAFRAYVGGKTHVVGAPPHVQNSACGFGGQLHALSLPALTAPPDTAGQMSITTQALLDFDITHPQPRDVSGMLPCGMTAPQPYFSGAMPGLSALLDWMDTAAWIDTETLRGIVQFGQLVDAIQGHVYEDGGVRSHSWYGGGTCPHGQIDHNHPSTGPGAGTLASMCWIWDPNDLIAVAQGTRTPHDITPTTTCRINALPQAAPIGPGLNGSGGRYRWGQAHYDPITKKLFVSEFNRDQYGCCTFVPRIHVFKVGA